ncbi:RNA methyltransferase [Breoghania sp.]|uniref:TrmH family RNA methyltransferase n=1 Tax=Breoghania sp. TaxID=2065378 RepID=UPI002AA5E444|nr:RNA methyltransferase [Breoghania sp.]
MSTPPEPPSGKPRRPNTRSARPGGKGRAYGKPGAQKYGSQKYGSQKRAAPDPDAPLLLYGLHTVEAAFSNPDRKRHRLVATRNALQRLEERGVKVDVPVDLVDPRSIARQVPRDAVHQGVLLQVDPLPAYDLKSLGDARLVLALDQVTDPHNVGAILRSSVALAADAVVTTHRHSPEEGAVLAKSASGALDMVRHLKVQNMARFLAEAGEAGFTRVALDSDGPAPLEETDLGQRLILVLGAEGKGVRQGVREACDTLARLDMPGKIRSLNVSNAAVLSLYVARKKLGL